jgi:transposase
LVDRGYDADAIREELAKAEVEAVIPAKSNRKSPTPHDREKYRRRNLVECACPMISQIIGCCAQQTQELAQGRHPLRQNQRALSRLRRNRFNQTVDTLCPRNLVLQPMIPLLPCKTLNLSYC